MYSSAGMENQLAAAVVVLSLIVSGYGLYQYFWGFDKIYQYIFYSGSDQIVKVPALDIVAKRRVSSTLALPGTLWGFLVCALPFHAMLWKRWRLLDAGLVVSALMLLATGFLTRSFGFLLGLFVLVVAAMLLRYRKRIWNRMTPIVILLVIVGGLFYSARRGTIQDSNPAGLRFKNWVSAWNIFEERPMGTGLNTFGVVYPEYMQPDANETQYVFHNTPLQLLSELGYPLILALIAIIIAKANALSAFRFSKRPETFWLLLALAVWIAHNLVDIDVYFPSVGVLGAILIGALFARPQREFPRLSKPSLAFMGTLALLAIVFSGLVCVSSELQNRAQIELESKKLLAATANVVDGAAPGPHQLEPGPRHRRDPAPALPADPRPAVSGGRNLFVSDGHCFESGKIRISYWLRTLPFDHRQSDARGHREQLRIAQRLYPNSTYVGSIARLMEQRIQ